MKQAVEDRLREIINEHLGVEESEITGNASLMDDLGADSLDYVEIVMAVEEEYAIEIDDETADSIRTFQELVDYVTKLTGGEKK